MPLPKSRGHVLVDLVKQKENLPQDTLLANENKLEDVSNQPCPENLEKASIDMDISLPVINITDQDLQQSLEFEGSRYSGLFSDIGTDGRASVFSPVIEFINQEESHQPEPNDIILNPANISSPTYVNIQSTEVPSTSDHTLEGSDIRTTDPCTNSQTYVHVQTIEEPTLEPTLESNGINTTEPDLLEGDRVALEDPDCLDVTSNETENIAVNGQTGRPKRGRKRKYAEQNRTIRKKKANSNQNYVSVTGKVVISKQFKGNIFNCLCPRKCTKKLSVEQRENEFKKFWSSGSYEARCAILQGSVQETEKKRCYSATSKRVFSRKHFLGGIEICKKTFLNTLSISQSRVDVALKKFKSQAPINDKRGTKSGGRNTISEQKLNEIRQFIEGLPKYTSHYCRDNRTALYLAPNLNLSIVYDLYKEKHENPAGISKFKQIFFKDFNLRFKKPQKDTCLRCDRFKASITSTTDTAEIELLKSEHKGHLDHAYKLRDQMKADLARAKTQDSVETLTFDLEKTHCLPRLPTSIVYYKRQLNLHNLGIHCGSSGRGYFYIWLEHEAGRGTQEVGSCIKKFISDHLKSSATELILWADSCGGQNRSIKMVLMLLHVLHNNNNLQKITVRFLQPGHTYLPNDSEFGDVECALKSHNRLYTADDYINVMKNCRRKNKFIVTRLQKDDFYSVAPLQERITNRKTDTQKQKISWLETFEIELRKSDAQKLFIKSKLEDDCKIIDISKGAKGRKVRPNFEMDLPVLYPEGRELSSAKVKDLKEMMKLIPADAKPFYNFIRNVRSRDFVDDTEGFGSTLDFDTESNLDE